MLKVEKENIYSRNAQLGQATWKYWACFEQLAAHARSVADTDSKIKYGPPGVYRYHYDELDFIF